MSVRLASAADRAEWLRLLLGLYPGTVADDHSPSMDAYFNGEPLAELVPSAVFVWARPDGRLGGCLELSVRDYAEGCAGRTPYIESWYVDDDLRGAGVGRGLMAAAEAWAVEHGFSELASDALLDNEVSHAAHAALGFEVVERSVHFRKGLNRADA